MKISVFGSGYVGLVTAGCLADLGNLVHGVDIDEAKVRGLLAGHSPIYEPGLEDLLRSNLESGRLTFSTDAKSAIEQADIVFIAVGTPPQADGSVDMQYIEAVARTIGQHLDPSTFKIIVNKSTVPVGSADAVRDWILASNSRLNSKSFAVVSNPEFLKEGSAIADFTRSDRIIIGSDHPQAIQKMKALYAPINRNRDKLMVMDARSAELTKYASNAMLATKISFMNELSRVAENLGADIEQVRLGMGADHRIGYDFTHPGCGYGGSCFPKDVLALKFLAESTGEAAELLTAVHQVNEVQKARLLKKIQTHYEGKLKGKIFALWGLAFKPNTDDIRSASSRVILEGLIAQGAKVQAYDPVAMGNIQKAYPDLIDKELTLSQSAEDALKNADALIVVTEWMEFRTPSFALMQHSLKDGVIFDGRNLYSPEELKALGLRYYSIGRGEI